MLNSIRKEQNFILASPRSSNYNWLTAISQSNRYSIFLKKMKTFEHNFHLRQTSSTLFSYLRYLLLLKIHFLIDIYQHSHAPQGALE